MREDEQAGVGHGGERCGAGVRGRGGGPEGKTAPDGILIFGKLGNSGARGGGSGPHPSGRCKAKGHEEHAQQGCQRDVGLSEDDAQGI